MGRFSLSHSPRAALRPARCRVDRPRAAPHCRAGTIFGSIATASRVPSARRARSTSSACPSSPWRGSARFGTDACWRRHAAPQHSRYWRGCRRGAAISRSTISRTSASLATSARADYCSGSSAVEKLMLSQVRRARALYASAEHGLAMLPRETLCARRSARTATREFDALEEISTMHSRVARARAPERRRGCV